MTHIYFIVLYVFFFYPQLSRMMGLDVIARKREWHIETCSKNDIKSAQQGLSRLVTFLSPHEEEATEQNQIWTVIASSGRRTCNVNYKTSIIHSTLLTSFPTLPSAMSITVWQYFNVVSQVLVSKKLLCCVEGKPGVFHLWKSMIII